MNPPFYCRFCGQTFHDAPTHRAHELICQPWKDPDRIRPPRQNAA